MRKPLGALALLGVLSLLFLTAGPGAGDETATQKKIRVLSIDGQNNHDWKATTPVMKKALEACGKFVVDVATTPQKPALPAEPKSDTAEELAKYKEALAKYADAYAVFRKEPGFNPDLGK